MRSLTRQLLISLVGGFLVAAALIAVVDSFEPPEIITDVLLWPVAACVYLVGPGPSIGPPEKHMHEGTPVHVVAARVWTVLDLLFQSCFSLAAVSIAAEQNRVFVLSHNDMIVWCTLRNSM
jgi:hypothetical protein